MHFRLIRRPHFLRLLAAGVFATFAVAFVVSGCSEKSSDPTGSDKAVDQIQELLQFSYRQHDSRWVLRFSASSGELVDSLDYGSVGSQFIWSTASYPYLDMKLSPDGATAFYCHWSGIWKSTYPLGERICEREAIGASRLALSIDGSRLLVWSDWEALLLDASDLSVLWRLFDEEGSVSATMHPGANRALVTRADTLIELSWPAGELAISKSKLTADGAVLRYLKSLAVSGDGTRLAVVVPGATTRALSWTLPELGYLGSASLTDTENAHLTAIPASDNFLVSFSTTLTGRDIDMTPYGLKLFDPDTGELEELLSNSARFTSSVSRDGKAVFVFGGPGFTTTRSSLITRYSLETLEAVWRASVSGAEFARMDILAAKR